MTLTIEQQRKVEENISLVHQVIKDKVHGYGQWGFYNYDDLFQIGCIGLCKAAATDKGGTFSTYAYCLIWHEICDALIKSTRESEREIITDVTPLIDDKESNKELDVFQNELFLDILQVLSSSKKDAPLATAKGIDAMILMSQGYTSREIGDHMGASAKLVCAWVSNARKFLKKRPEVVAIASSY